MTLIICALSLVAFFYNYQNCYAQYYSSSDWMNDKPYQDIVSSLSIHSGSSSSVKSSKSKHNRSRDSRSGNSYYYDYSAEIRRQAAAAEAERLRIAEAERIRKEEEFRADKTELQESLRGYKSAGSASGYSSGLRGLSNYNSNNNERTSFSSGLRGVSDDSSPAGGKTNYSAGLKGYSEETSNTNIYAKSDEMNNNASGNEKNEELYSPTITRDTRVNSNTYSLDSKSGLSLTHKHFASTKDYTTYISVYNPQPIYYQGQGSSFYRMGIAEDGDGAWLDLIEEKIDIWREAGEYKVLTYIGDKLTGFARETVSKSSTVGAWFYKVLDIANEGVGIKNLVVKTAERNLNAIRKSTISMTPRYVNDANKTNKREIDSYASTALEKKGLLPPDAQSLDRKAQNTMKDLAETGAVKGFELWLSRREKE